MNKWPEEKILPNWRRRVADYSDLLLDLSVKLRTILAISLGLERDFFNTPGYFDYSSWLLGFVHYFSGSPSSPSSGKYGIRPHTDCGIFTLLASDGLAYRLVWTARSGSVYHLHLLGNWWSTLARIWRCGVEADSEPLCTGWSWGGRRRGSLYHISMNLTWMQRSNPYQGSWVTFGRRQHL